MGRRMVLCLQDPLCYWLDQSAPFYGQALLGPTQVAVNGCPIDGGVSLDVQPILIVASQLHPFLSGKSFLALLG